MRPTWQSRVAQSAGWILHGRGRTHTSGIRLDVDAPFLGIEVERLQGSLAAEVLELVDPLVAAIVACTGETLGVLVGQDRAIGLDRGTAGQVL